MRPVKRLFLLSAWLMRLVALLFVLNYFWNSFTDFHYSSFFFYISALFVVFTVLLFIGGFLYKESLTVFSSFILILVTIVFAILELKFGLNTNFLTFMMLGAIFIYFFTKGNKK